MIFAPSREIVAPERCDRCGGWKSPSQRAGVRPHWRGGTRAWNTAGKAQRNANGKRTRNASGKHNRNTATITTCCCEEDFENCAALGIKCASVVIEGYGMCGTYLDGGGAVYRQDSGSINGTYLVPVCGTTGNHCYLWRSFCGVATYGIVGQFSGVTSFLYGSVFTIFIDIDTSTSPDTITIITYMGHYKEGCCQFGFSAVDCWVPNTPIPEPTPPGPGVKKFCPCASNPTTFAAGGGVGTIPVAPIHAPGSHAGPATNVFDTRTFTGTIAPYTFNNFTSSCATFPTTSGPFGTGGGTTQVTIHYTAGDCPHANADDADCECDCGEDI